MKNFTVIIKKISHRIVQNLIFNEANFAQGRLMRQFLMVQGTNRSTLFHFSFTALNRETQISGTEKIAINGCLTCTNMTCIYYGISFMPFIKIASIAILLHITRRMIFRPYKIITTSRLNQT